ncbi:Alpha/Beta hydrolase protein [Aspergillus pseudonomiae]|uniref:Alpha/Beta hydrolase protein n=1 Tax=Aspergillus pseudonomiae TaxID=1506151 RepID=A0A5N7D7H0_9EURO|nr:Alpha/Beta hydrolase protein [Aspergillus pseudonomiae]KAB8260334.1 Alpha/Beta hydrolase protein [Aspergillus pseudonomiae]KAE8402371.1 Alpha/Beta hydrolase protein [Aspergillus pseudonomiae]
MPHENIEFQTADHVTLRGWFFRSSTKPSETRLPCLVMSHGFSALKEMDLDTFAEYFTQNLPICCLVYDNRGFGDSDTKAGQPRHEILPSQQTSDISDAITYAQSRADVDPDRIGIWGSSYSGGHVLWVGAVDRRVKAVLSHAPFADGWTNMNRLIRPDMVEAVNKGFQEDRLARAAGKPPVMMKVVDKDPLKPSALPTPDSYQFFSAWEAKSNWKNEVTLKSLEAAREYYPSAHIHRISPTPLLMTVAENDVITPTDIALEAYSRAREPKKLHIFPGGHFDGYSGKGFERIASAQAEFLKEYLV